MISLVLALAMLLGLAAGCANDDGKQTLNVYNW